MVGRCIFYWNSAFLGDMLVFRGVSEHVWNCFLKAANYWFVAVKRSWMLLQNDRMPLKSLKWIQFFLATQSNHVMNIDANVSKDNSISRHLAFCMLHILSRTFWLWLNLKDLELSILTSTSSYPQFERSVSLSWHLCPRTNPSIPSIPRASWVPYAWNEGRWDHMRCICRLEMMAG